MKTIIGVEQNSKTGFTLVETLVVIAVIGILSTIVLVSLNEARGRARYAAMVNQLQEIRKASEIHRARNGGEWAPDVNNNVAPAFVPQYLAKWPEPDCSKYSYDWENWGTPEGKIVRISIRERLNPNETAYTSQIYLCLQPNDAGSCVREGTHVGEDVSITQVRSFSC